MNLNAQYPLHKGLNVLLPKVECVIHAWSPLEGKVRASSHVSLAQEAHISNYSKNWQVYSKSEPICYLEHKPLSLPREFHI